ncbi:MAG TPA: glucokinase [Gammaproteobacteria bacterium]|nr:glucokinase [Gammaproteobacteria bacterium]
MAKRHRRILAGDVGGTKTSLALVEVDGTQLDVLAQEQYPSTAYGSLLEVVRQFLADRDAACEYAGFGVAGPVRDGKCHTTNLPWQLDATELASGLGLRRAWLLNDLEANAWGIRALRDEDFHNLSDGAPNACGNASIIAAGTGLGQAGLFWDGARHHPFSSEGGHTDFAPGSELEISLLHYLQQRYDHVSWERVVSGMGLLNLHAFLTRHRKVAIPGWLDEEMRNGDSAAAITGAAQADRCPVCRETLELFVRLYGVEAGNQALKIMATGGVYIGGGIAPRILDSLKEGTFLSAFWSKGRMEPLMRSMPVRVILNPDTALYGAAVYADNEARQIQGFVT